MHYRAEPVDAARVPSELGGFRTLFTSFHHFPPRQAREILRDAVAKGRGIGIFEIPGRRPLTLLLLPLVLVGDILVVPFLRPRPFARMVWRWLIPIVPLVLLFDGIVSCLRAYSPGELRGIDERVGGSGLSLESGMREARVLAAADYVFGWVSGGVKFKSRSLTAVQTAAGFGMTSLDRTVYRRTAGAARNDNVAARSGEKSPRATHKRRERALGYKEEGSALLC